MKKRKRTGGNREVPTIPPSCDSSVAQSYLPAPNHPTRSDYAPHAILMMAGSILQIFSKRPSLHSKVKMIIWTKKSPGCEWRVRIRTTTKYRSEQEKSFRETGRISLSFKSLLVYTLGLRMQYRGVYKEECSMKKVCASLFLIILLLAAIVPVSAAGTLR